MLLDLDYFTMLWNLFVFHRVLFILERLRILNRSFNLCMMRRSCHMMNFNILTIYRHLEIFDNFWFFIEVSKL